MEALLGTWKKRDLEPAVALTCDEVAEAQRG
jgi:hypothetical protein